MFGAGWREGCGRGDRGMLFLAGFGFWGFKGGFGVGIRVRGGRVGRRGVFCESRDFVLG